MSQRPEDVKELEKVPDPENVASATDTDNRELSDEELGRVSGGVSEVAGHRRVVVDSPL